MLLPAGGRFIHFTTQGDFRIANDRSVRRQYFYWASLTHLRCRSKVLPNHPCLSQHFFIVWVRLATNNGAFGGG